MNRFEYNPNTAFNINGLCPLAEFLWFVYLGESYLQQIKLPMEVVNIDGLPYKAIKKSGYNPLLSLGIKPYTYGDPTSIIRSSDNHRVFDIVTASRTNNPTVRYLKPEMFKHSLRTTTALSYQYEKYRLMINKYENILNRLNITEAEVSDKMIELIEWAFDQT